MVNRSMGSWLTDKNTKRQKDGKGQDQKTKRHHTKKDIFSSFCIFVLQLQHQMKIRRSGEQNTTG